jgi:hypothetical protein
MNALLYAVGCTYIQQFCLLGNNIVQSVKVEDIAEEHVPSSGLRSKPKK